MSKQTAVAGVAVMDEVGQGVATKTAGPAAAPAVDRGLVAQLVGDAQRQGLPVDGEGGLLAELTRLVLESALDLSLVTASRPVTV